MFETNANPEFDARDKETLQRREAAWNARQGPRVGDYVEMLDGRLMRFSHDWGDDIQVSTGGSFYLSDGSVSFSGGLEPAIHKARFENTGGTKAGRFWFFHHNHACAHNGVYFDIPCRVWEQAA